jgi:hypothetical protein
MRTSSRFPNKARKQRGYALVLVVFLTTLMLISVMAIAPAIRTEKQREKEEEMIWRGKQYVRGIKLFYRKNGRFPTSMDDLTKPKLGSLRFMRKAYKDPINTKDGAWRLIYVGPAGQLIGSLKPQQTFQLPGVAGATPASAVGQQASGQGQSGFGAASGFGQTGAQAGSQPGTQNTALQAGSTGSGQGNGAAPAADGSTLPASTTSNYSPVIGGNIIGVGSKIDKSSIIVYDKAKNYRLFEFVWNPSKDLMNALGQAGTQVGTPNSPGRAAGQGQGTGFGQPATNPPNQPNMPEPTPVPPPPQPQP